ncbi:MAG TPA: hypothetical protein VHC22_04125 [Pirellulales bacterium]|nr:hypothetical protein [Pirellulales bacterium]
MRYYGPILFVCLVATGCQTPVPRGKFHLPEDSFLTLKRIETLVPVGMPIDQAREVMEIHGFVCTFQESVGIPYLQCNQIKRRSLWPFNGTWMATIYYEDGIVHGVQARYDLNPTEVGECIPKRTARKARQIDQEHDAKTHAAPPDAGPQPGAMVVPSDDDVLYIEPSSPGQLAPPAQEGQPASVPVEIP